MYILITFKSDKEISIGPVSFAVYIDAALYVVSGIIAGFRSLNVDVNIIVLCLT